MIKPKTVNNVLNAYVPKLDSFKTKFPKYPKTKLNHRTEKINEMMLDYYQATREERVFKKKGTDTSMRIR